MALSLTACGGADDGKYTIGICQLVTHEALDAATKGFQDAVIAALGEENVTFDLQNAAGEWFQFDYVPGEENVRMGTAGVIGKLCVIGSQIDEQGIAGLFGV